MKTTVAILVPLPSVSVVRTGAVTRAISPSPSGALAVREAHDGGRLIGGLTPLHQPSGLQILRTHLINRSSSRCEGFGDAARREEGEDWVKSATDEQRCRIAKEPQPFGLGASKPSGFVASRSREHYR